MKINNLQVGDNDLYGRRFNGHDLLQDFNKAGIGSNYLAVLPSIFRETSHELLFNQFFLNADIVHYHLNNDHFFDFNYLPILTKLKPTVWALHDIWALSGHYLPVDYQTLQKNCNLHADLSGCNDSTAINYKFKEIAFQSSDFDVVVTSKWMFDKVSFSPLFKNKKIHLISPGLNLDVFRPRDKQRMRASFGIPHENFVICVCITKVEYKGLAYTKELLKLLKNTKTSNITIITYNESGLLAGFEDSFQIIELGQIHEELRLAKMHAVADVYLSTSLIEDFGISVVESLASGTPVLAFDGTAITEIIEAPIAGIVVPATNIYAMKDELIDLMSNAEKLNQLALNARNLAHRKYNKVDYVKKIIEVYTEVMGRRGFDTRSNFIIKQQQDILAQRHAADNIIGYSTLLTQDVISRMAIDSDMPLVVQDTTVDVVECNTTVNIENQQPVIDLAIINSRIYKTLIRLRERRLPRILYFNIARPAFRILKKVKNYVKK